MKKLMTMVSAIMMVAAVNASEVTTVAFNETMVNIPARVRFVQGDSYGFNVEAKDSVVARSLQCSVKDGVLRIGFGSALKPGETKYDAKKDTYYYGVNENSQMLMSGNSEDDVVITVVSPEMPRVKTSSDYVAVSVQAVESVRKDGTSLSLSE